MNRDASTPAILEWDALDARSRREALARAPQTRDARLVDGVERIIEAVRREGDAAVRRLTRELDGVDVTLLAVSAQALVDARQRVATDVREAVEQARANIHAFHARQKDGPIRVEPTPGVVCERRPMPLQRVGLYVPGGSAPLISTVLMLAVPATIAGCDEVILCTPPSPGGEIHPALLYAADACGVQRIFRVGGAQAVAAMAFGTESLPKVDKIFGPGNAWVTEAKRQVAQDPQGTALDLPAGPSEVLVVADGSARAEWVAADLLSQLEHGPDSQALLVTTDRALAQAVIRSLDTQLKSLPRADIARRALAWSRVILVRDLVQAMTVANAYAPEHLILNVEDAGRWAERVRAAGSVFLGPYSPEAVGDYASGTNHVLPTYGWARALSGLSVADFQLHVTFQALTRDGLAAIAPTVMTLARAEGLDAHERAVACRLEASR